MYTKRSRFLSNIRNLISDKPFCNNFYSEVPTKKKPSEARKWCGSFHSVDKPQTIRNTHIKATELYLSGYCLFLCFKFVPKRGQKQEI